MPWLEDLKFPRGYQMGTHIKLLIDKGMKKTDLAKEAKLTPATLAKLSKQETVSMDTLIRICGCLDCTFDDVVELIKN